VNERSDLVGKCAIVTGSTRGIGRAIAAELLARGAEVAVNGRDAASTDEAARTLGPRAFAVPGDITSPETVEAIVAAAVAKAGGVDLLVNNAGTNRIQAAEDLPLAEWERLLALNLTAPFLCSRAVVASMRARGGGAIVSIASLTSFLPFARRLPYCVTKAGLVMMTQVLAAEWAPTIRVNAVAPGYVETDLIASQDAAGTLRVSDILARVPMQRLAQPEEIARAVAFLLSDDAAYVTGSTLVVDGGFLVDQAPG
jgi:NAD(P)-dependent dehydrogenase (short-subunit alcohol dehydrogenase family)